jgi:hypothetical protein
VSSYLIESKWLTVGIAILKDGTGPNGAEAFGPVSLAFSVIL